MKALAALGALVGLAVIGFLMYMSYSNSEVRLRNAVKAQQESNTTSFDTCWKIIQGQAQVADKYKDSFKEIYVGLMEGRHYEKGGSLMKFITESNPNFDIRLFEKVSNSIEAQRTIFKRDQDKLIDLKREHDNMLTTMPGSFFVGGRPPVEIKIVTSTKTEKTFETRKEDDVDVFNTKK
jgi:hypothetical protein